MICGSIKTEDPAGSTSFVIPAGIGDPAGSISFVTQQDRGISWPEFILQDCQDPNLRLGLLNWAKKEEEESASLCVVAQCIVCLCLDMVRMNNLEIRVVQNMITA